MKISTLPDTLVEFIAILKEQGVSEKNYQKYVGDYLEYSARNKNIPFHGQFELTPFCNLDCKMCYVHLNHEQYPSQLLLDTATWKRIIDEAIICGMRKVSLTGGECLTYTGFDEIFLYLLSKKMSVGILSNALLLTDERIQFFMDHPPRNIQVTIYGSNDAAYENVTGKRVFHVIRNNILKARDAGLHLTLSITPSRFMQKDLHSLIAMVDSWGIRYGINSQLMTPRKNTGRSKEDMTLDQYIEMFKFRDKLKHWVTPESISPEELPEEGHGSESQIGLKCGAGRSSFHMKYNGWICPCASLEEIDANVLQIGFKSAWEKINYQANHYILPAECNGCFYRKVCPDCAGMHKEAKGHCNTRVCERTKRLVSEGFTPMPKQ